MPYPSTSCPGSAVRIGWSHTDVLNCEVKKQGIPLHTTNQTKQTFLKQWNLVTEGGARPVARHLKAVRSPCLQHRVRGNTVFIIFGHFDDRKGATMAPKFYFYSILPCLSRRAWTMVVFKYITYAATFLLFDANILQNVILVDCFSLYLAQIY